MTPEGYKKWRTPENLGRKKAYVQELRKARIALGICYRCGRNDARPGLRSCGCKHG